MQNQEHFYSKLLLFGEYSILFGSSALSIPYSHFQAELSFVRDDKYTDLEQALKSNAMLRGLAVYFKDEWKEAGDYLDLSRFSRDLEEGLYLESTIPQGYGLGSSGAVCAAVYNRYRTRRSGPSLLTTGQIIDLRAMFSRMESFFHGQSSGIDPLAIYLRSPLHVNNSGNPAIVGIPRNWDDKPSGIFLINSGHAGKTSSYVPEYLALFAPGGKVTPLGDRLRELSDACTASLLDAKIPQFWQSLAELSLFQFNHMSSIIPDSMQDIWKTGNESALYQLKICGSGGGGFLIGFAPDYHQAQASLKKKGIQTIAVYLAGG